jgi:hypothetical protein
MKTTHSLSATSIKAALPLILEIEPTLCSMVKGRKGDSFTTVLYDAAGKVMAKWVKHSNLAIERGWATEGSHLEIIRF